MANLNSLFNDFNGEIKLSSAKRNDLISGRNALRADIKSWFSDNEKKQPKFHGQGSFSMNTVINPLPGDEYDLDDGVYLQGYSNDMDSWPSASTVHSWIKKATDDRTSVDSTDKNTCVRVNYASNYHIDLPIYIMNDDNPFLAHKSEGWTESDPKEFTDWFLSKVETEGEQLRRVVRYLKAWKDYKEVSLKSIEITILATDNFDFFENRDDKALLYTVNNIIGELEFNFKCVKPSAPYNDLFEDFSETKKSSILSSLNLLSSKLDEAICEANSKTASEIIRTQFGTRFPLGADNISSSKYEVTNTPGVIKNDGRSGQ